MRVKQAVMERQVRIKAGRTPLALALLCALAACQGKETGPDDTATTAAAPLVAPPITAATADPDAARPLASFAGKDADGDGRLTSAEYANAAQTMFRMMDADKDGVVTADEHRAAREAMGVALNVSSDDVIAANDSDNNGNLTLSEWMAGANAQFDALDTDQDGSISAAEWDAVSRSGTVPITAPRTKTQ